MRSKHITYVTLLALLPMGGCSLDEYNPMGGMDGGSPLTTVEGFEGLQTYCYDPIYGQLYSAYDYLSVADGGTDLFLCPGGNKDYAKQLIYYDGLVTNTNAVKKLFMQLYSMINSCNAVIGQGGVVKGLSERDQATLVAEAKTLRAYYYLMLTTYYGNVTLELNTSDAGVDQRPKRATYEELYGQIVQDLKDAVAVLGPRPYKDQHARATKATAGAILALAYAQGAGDCDLHDAASGKGYWNLCLDQVNDMLANSADYGFIPDLKPINELWAARNNRHNPEAIFIAAGPDGTKPNVKEPQFSNMHTYVYPNPNKLNDIYPTSDKNNYLYGRTNNCTFAASKYLLGLFDPTWDARWENTFTLAFGEASGMQTPDWGQTYDKHKVNWSKAICQKYGKDKVAMGADTITYPYADWQYVPGTWNQYVAKVWPKGEHSGDIKKLVEVDNILATPWPFDLDDDRFSIYLSKEPVTAEEQKTKTMHIVNIDDLFDADGMYKTAMFDGTASYNLFPGLTKWNWNFNGAWGKDLQRKTGDFMVLRTAELYLLGAEAAERLGNGGKAAEFLNVVRKRACRTADLWGTAVQPLSTATEQDVLDEWARELCGECNRWALLKRHHAFEKQLPLGNSRAAANFDPSKHYLRPISYTFLSEILNADEYGTNGY